MAPKRDWFDTHVHILEKLHEVRNQKQIVCNSGDCSQQPYNVL